MHRADRGFWKGLSAIDALSPFQLILDLWLAHCRDRYHRLAMLQEGYSYPWRSQFGAWHPNCFMLPLHMHPRELAQMRMVLFMRIGLEGVR